MSLYIDRLPTTPIKLSVADDYDNELLLSDVTLVFHHDIRMLHVYPSDTCTALLGIKDCVLEISLETALIQAVQQFIRGAVQLHQVNDGRNTFLGWWIIPFTGSSSMSLQPVADYYRGLEEHELADEGKE